MYLSEQTTLWAESSRPSLSNGSTSQNEYRSVGVNHLIDEDIMIFGLVEYSNSRPEESFKLDRVTIGLSGKFSANGVKTQSVVGVDP